MNTNGANKLAIFVPNLNGGGAEYAMLKLAHGFAEAGRDVDLVLAQAKGPYLSKVQKTIRLVDLGAPRVLSSMPNLARYLRGNQPRALLSALDYANVVALWARRVARTPGQVAVNEQNTISLSAANSLRRRQRMVPYLVKRFYPWANIIIGNSEGVVDDLVKVTGLPRRRIHMLYNPVITPELREKSREALVHPWFSAGQDPVVLAVGRLTAQKDFPLLIRAFAEMRRSRTARLLILGEGPDRPALEALVSQLGLEAEVAMPGFVENPYAFMSRAAAFVLSSLWEGLPTVLIEALFCGAPVIATDCPSGPREILRDGKYGELVPMGEVGALVAALDKALSGRVVRPPAESWRPYEIETVVSQYTNLLFGN